MIETVKMVGKSVLTALLLVLAILMMWMSLSTAAYGGWWIPGEISHFNSNGYWLLLAPEQSVTSFEDVAKEGSESYAAVASVGRLKDTAGNDRLSTICDNYRNGLNAMQSSSNLNGKAERTFDTNGFESGCGGETLSFDADAHTATEGVQSDGDWVGTGTVSFHRND